MAVDFLLSYLILGCTLVLLFFCYLSNVATEISVQDTSFHLLWMPQNLIINFCVREKVNCGNDNKEY